MKNVISLSILIIFIIAITTFTVYTLTHKEIKDTQTITKTKTIEKATSNMTDTELNETYNIQINGKRHRLKTNYRLVSFDDKSAIILTLYLDGFEIYTNQITAALDIQSLSEIFSSIDDNPLIIADTDIQILDLDQDYLLVNIHSDIEGLKEEYYVWTDDRKSILAEVLRYDESIVYVGLEDEELTMFYDQDEQILAKVEDNVIYALESLETEEGIVLEEYTYTIKNEEVTKELINTYSSLSVQ